MTEDLLQSDGWERFQQALGRKTHRVDGALAIEMPLPFGGVYLYSPRSILPLRHCEEGRRPSARRGNLKPSAQHLVQEIGAIFWRAEYDGQVSGVPISSRLRWASRCQVSEPRILRRAVEPEWTWRTLLVGSDDERLMAMHEKHRYNVRLAAKRGVTVRVVPPPLAPPPGEEGKGNTFLPFHGNGGGARGGGDVEICWKLLQDTAKRQRISTHPRSYYETMLKTLGGQVSGVPASPGLRWTSRCKVFLAEHNSTPIACAIVAYHGDTATYLHGGSSYEYRGFMAPHLLHWRAMCDAKAAGLHWYDWGGIEPQVSGVRCQVSGVDWSGMTRFKMGFGGETVHHPPLHDLVFHPGWYRLLLLLARLQDFCRMSSLGMTQK